MSARPKKAWNEAPKWANVLLRSKNGSDYVFAESHKTGSKAWPQLSYTHDNNSTFELDASFWILVENRSKVHPHAKLIKRWVEDTSLIILGKTDGSPWSRVRAQTTPTWYVGAKYFLVVEKHAEIALAWLNGAEIQLQSNIGWVDYKHDEIPNFVEQYEYRIKPKTEKVTVWVGILITDSAFLPRETVTRINPTLSNIGPWVNDYLWTEVTVDKPL